MEADCEDYIDPLTFDLSGNMGIAISNWDNLEGRADFEFNHNDNPSGTCGDFTISYIRVETFGYDEKKEEDATPDPGPEPAKW